MRRWVIAIVLFGAAVTAIVVLARHQDRAQTQHSIAYTVRGIDISHHQGSIDWRRIAAQHISFAWLKASEGARWSDPSFADHFAKARAAGLKLGAYHYFTLCAPGALQAANFLRAQTGPTDLPFAVDLEYVGNCAQRPQKARFRHELTVFLDALQKQRHSLPVLYTVKNFYDDYLASGGTFGRYPLWIRSFAGQSDWSGAHVILFRQQTRSSRLAGFDGPVDLDLFTGTKAQFEMLH